MKCSLSTIAVLAVAILAVPATRAASPGKKAELKPTGELVALFDAMEAGEIEVKLIPKDAKTGTILVTNKTKKPLSIKLPEAFAGVPVAAQFGGCPGGGFGGCPGGGGMMGGNQGLGGGGMMGAGMGGMGGQVGGFFNVAPEKVAKVKIGIVCLDHGKEDPSPHVPYKIVPIETYAKDAEAISAVVGAMCRGEVDQHTAQAAAWHLQNGLTWEQLAAKVGAKHLNGSTEPYFSRAHLQRAVALSKAAQSRSEAAAKSKPQTVSTGESQAE
jgi:hypothetical protein